MTGWKTSLVIANDRAQISDVSSTDHVKSGITYLKTRLLLRPGIAQKVEGLSKCYKGESFLSP